MSKRLQWLFSGVAIVSLVGVVALGIFFYRYEPPVKVLTPEEAMDLAAGAKGAAIGYTLNEAPLSTDQLLGIDDPSGSWAINRFSLQGLIGAGVTGHMNPISVSTCEGQHDGANDAAILTDGGESWTTSAYVGMTLVNVTDGSSCTVTANNGTTMTCTLAGGTDNNWDTNDYWAVAPGPFQSGSVVYISSTTTIMHPATAGYAACYYSTGANAVKVDPLYTDAAASTMRLWLNGEDTGTDGDELDSESGAGDFICIHNVSSTVGRTLGRDGAWTDGGAS